MLANVRQATIRPLIQASVAAGTLIHTDEYDIYARLETWGHARARLAVEHPFTRTAAGSPRRESPPVPSPGYAAFLRSSSTG